MAHPRALRRSLTAGGLLLVLSAIAPTRAGAQEEATGFDGYIQSGTCAAPTDDLRVELKTESGPDVQPYRAKAGTGDETVVLGHYGAPGAPGFGVSVLAADLPFSLVFTDAETGEPVTCGELLEPDLERYREVGIAVVQLLPVGGSNVQGFAVLDRAAMQRELDVTPTRVRALLTTDEVVTPPSPAVGYDGYVQSGTCASPGDRVRVYLKTDGDHDVMPYLAAPSGDGDPVTVAYYGTARAPGFGLAAAYTGQPFSLVVTGAENTGPVACGDLLEPDDDAFKEAGLALVQLAPVDDSGVQGYALIERIGMQRELDVIPTRVRILLFAPPVDS